MTSISDLRRRLDLGVVSGLAVLAVAVVVSLATSVQLVGGDLYEVAATPFGVPVIVGDVRGKGVEAVQTAATVLGAFRAAAFTAPDLAQLTRTIDETLARMIGDEEFVTAIVGEFHGDRVTLANCGHHPPLLVVGSDVTTADTGEPALPLGLGARPVLTEHPWPVGARVLFYTDGLIETRDPSGEFFPLDDYTAELGEGTVEEALDRLVERLLAWGGQRMSDDLALVLAESEPL